MSILYHIKVVSSQWLLTLKMHRFLNPLNVEVRQGSICCCDLPICQTIEIFESGICEEKCDTYFRIELSDCEIADPCPVVMFTNVFVNSANETKVNDEFEFSLRDSPPLPVCMYVCTHARTCIRIFTFAIPNFLSYIQFL